MWTHKGGIFFGKLLRIKLFLQMFSDYLLCVFQTRLIPSTFPPGMAVKAKINLFLCSLAAGMDNIGKTTINTWFCAVLGSVGGSWHWKTMEPKTWIWSYRRSFESFLNPTKSFLDSKSTLNSQVFIEPHQVQKSAWKFHPALPDGFFPMFFQLWCLLEWVGGVTFSIFWEQELRGLRFRWKCGKKGFFGICLFPLWLWPSKVVEERERHRGTLEGWDGAGRCLGSAQMF